jgi:hypothetical protein
MVDMLEGDSSWGSGNHSASFVESWQLCSEFPRPTIPFLDAY